LIEYRTHTCYTCICEHYEFQIRGCFEVVEFVFSCAVGEKTFACLLV
jgi:hypothetical protein